VRDGSRDVRMWGATGLRATDTDRRAGDCRGDGPGHGSARSRLAFAFGFGFGSGFIRRRGESHGYAAGGRE
jgi:hypothetical protein